MLTYLDTAAGFAVVMLAISLLLTILTQIVSALANYRGRNLLWGLKTLFANLDPGAYPALAAEAEPLARRVLKHRLISDSWFSGNRVAEWIERRSRLCARLFDRFRLASAIRSTELANILRQIAAQDPHLAGEIAAVLSFPAAAAAVAGGPPALPGVAPAVDFSASPLGAWFGSTMDRVSQRFAMTMRLWTIAFAAFFTLATGLNTLDLLTGLYHNGVMRDALVGAGQQMTTTATAALDPQNSLSAKFTAGLLEALQAQGIDAPKPAPVILTTADGTRWIDANVPPQHLTAVLTAFQTGAQAAIRKSLADDQQTAETLLSLTSKAGIDVLQFHWPAGFFRWSSPWTWRLRYLLGVFLTGAMLSLGAPFWFNCLKSLANLRPILASKEAAESAGDSN
jgi:hypothetical protein